MKRQAWRTPAVRCPNCGAPPAIRVPPLMRRLAEEPLPENEMVSVQCPVVWCQTVYSVRFGEVVLAS